MSACQTMKQPVSADTYKEKLEVLGYEIIDITIRYSEYTPVIQALGSNSDGIHIEFFEISSAKDSAEMFAINKEERESAKGSSYAEESKRGVNYKYYSLETSDKYYVLVQLENTFVNAYSEKPDAGKLDGIIRDLGYK
jgi:hypothetical protein